MAARATPEKVAVASPRQTDIQLSWTQSSRPVLEVMLNEGWWVCATAKFELDKLPNYSANSDVRQCGTATYPLANCRKMTRPAIFPALLKLMLRVQYRTRSLPSGGAQCGNPCPRDLHILFRLDARNADGADHVAVDDHRHAAFEHAFQLWRAQEGHAAAIDHVFIDLRFTAAERGGIGLGRRDIRRDRRRAVQALLPQQVAAGRSGANSLDRSGFPGSR